MQKKKKKENVNESVSIKYDKNLEEDAKLSKEKRLQ